MRSRVNSILPFPLTGLASIPWISWGAKVCCYVLSIAHFPISCLHMWNMFAAAVEVRECAQA